MAGDLEARLDRALRDGDRKDREKRRAKYVVRFNRAHVVVHPATVLLSRTIRDGEDIKVADIPEKRDEYAAGQEVPFGSKRAARDFVRAMGGAADLL